MVYLANKTFLHSTMSCNELGQAFLIRSTKVSCVEVTFLSFGCEMLETKLFTGSNAGVCMSMCDQMYKYFLLYKSFFRTRSLSWVNEKTIRTTSSSVYYEDMLSQNCTRMAEVVEIQYFLSTGADNLNVYSCRK